MWYLLLILYAASKQLHSIEEPKLILKNGAGPCDGSIAIFHDNVWGTVGTQKWNRTNEDVICKSLSCGTSKGSEDYYYSSNINNDIDVLMNEVECNGTEKRLWDCKFPGWKATYDKSLKTKKITCSDKIAFKLESVHDCVGPVKYIKTSIINPKVNTSGYLCHTNWGKRQADIVCKNLHCGESKRLLSPGMFSGRDRNAESKTIQCRNDEVNLWQCEPKDDETCTDHVSVMCTGHLNLRLKGKSNVCAGLLEIEDDKGLWNPVCQSKNSTQILSLTPANICKNLGCGTHLSESPITCGNGNVSLECTDRIRTVLLDRNNVESKCFGSVYFNISSGGKYTTEAVCDEGWNTDVGDIVCKELQCGELVSFRSGNPIRNGKHRKVDCQNSETSLWHCLARHYDTSVERKAAYVICSGSVDARLSDGPGRCAGRVEIKYENTWKSVKSSNWKSRNSKVLCNTLKCGSDADVTDLFIQRKSPIMTKELICNKNPPLISKCIGENDKTSTLGGNQMLVCLEHKVMFLMGNSSCSGTVGIAQNSQSYWLSNDTWHHTTATVVCQQMHCGNATKATSVPVDSASAKMSWWTKSYNCSSTEKSLFECEQSNSTGQSMAYVECSGNKTVGLKGGEKCWGKVDVCIQGKCGGVCLDAWDRHRSNILCEELGCGTANYPLYNQTKSNGVFISSIHIPQVGIKLSQSNMVTNDDSYCQDKPAYVFCSASVKAKLHDKRDRCSGNLQLFDQGDWRIVCKEALQEQNVKDIICKELGCGEAEALIPFISSSSVTNEKFVVSQLACEDQNLSLSECKVTTQKLQNIKNQCTPSGLRCSAWNRMFLDKGGGACNGQVLMYENNHIIAVSSDDWTETEAEVLCKSLGCGGYKRHWVPEDPGDINTWWTKTVNCTRTPTATRIWDCDINDVVPGKTPLRVECDDVFDMQKGVCHGTVKLNDMEVCAENWDANNAQIICSGRQCGRSIDYRKTKKSSGKSQLLVSCHGFESSLEQCKTENVTCDEVISVSCTDAVQFNFTEKCGGKMVVSYGEAQKSVCPLKNLEGVAEMLCEEMKCGTPIRIETNTKSKPTSGMPTIKCGKGVQLKSCINTLPCETAFPGELYCSDYVPPKIPWDPTGLIVGLSLTAFALVMIIIFVFLRQRFVTRFKSRFSKRKVSAFESGDYEDVDDIETDRMSGSIEMRDKKQHEMAGDEENGRQSVASSQSYDDVEEERIVTEPLTSGRDGTGSPVPEAGSDAFNEHVTYEVEEDSQECYDDILSETREEVADVHPRPKSVDLQLLDDDYLEPDGLG
ncbi:hypothetical protein DPEC_G00008590 [Dallia pectoralis]|uniref:Uncharacterized protein n=1 Tax=Dallia pectoralis TaxID=75939 RepID=A0ACC2HM69_DALPE|nr:hypothetical protein DPEC_G00008590 [Dallia pectoralis]